MLSSLDVCFAYAAPEDKIEYERTFGQVTIRFGAPFCGFEFDRRHLDLPLETADAKLHRVLRKHVEQVVAELPRARSLSEEVRAMVIKELPGGRATAVRIAQLLQMSRRALGRKLTRENTTFAILLDDVRKECALSYVGRDLELTAVAELLGFSQTGAFHRAFKRWTGQTPLQYRQAQKAVRFTGWGRQAAGGRDEGR
jgi:AraC-like DNA-binding protein